MEDVIQEPEDVSQHKVSDGGSSYNPFNEVCINKHIIVDTLVDGGYKSYVYIN